MTKIGRNDPCLCGSGKKYKHCCMGKEPTEQDAATTGPLDITDSHTLDRRRMERASAGMTRFLDSREWESIEEADALLAEAFGGGGVPEFAAETPLERAQDRMYDAFEATGRRRVKLAREALAISPDCADAYVLLAEETAASPKEALRLYEQGVSAGRRAVGEQAFEEDAGHFWGILETRPYMRALFGKAEALAVLNRHDAAIGVARELLRLNPGDNQGVRYFLLRELLIAGDDAAAAELLREYPDDPSAPWTFSAALVKFRQTGDALFARRALLAAVESNPFVPPYLLGTKRPPSRMPPYYSLGDDSEAQWYVGEHLRVWTETPGAIDWLRRVLAETDAIRNDEADVDMAGVLDPSGPAFFLNPYEHLRFTRCPSCDGPTKLRQRYPVVWLDPQMMVVTKTGCRYCETCDLLVAHADEVEAFMAEVLQHSMPELIGNDYVPMGFLEPSDMRGRPEGPLEPEWALQRLNRFRAFEQYADPWEDQLLAFAEEFPDAFPAGPEIVRATR